nr:MAG TPA: hypothetical protein [Caudoviricetes sp.]
MCSFSLCSPSTFHMKHYPALLFVLISFTSATVYVSNAYHNALHFIYIGSLSYMPQFNSCGVDYLFDSFIIGNGSWGYYCFLNP